MSPWGVNVSIIEAGAHKTKLLNGDILAEQWQSLWSGLSEEMKQEYGGKEGLQRGNPKRLRQQNQLEIVCVGPEVKCIP